MDNNTERLVNLLEEALVLLRCYEVDKWANWLSNVIADIKAGHFYGIEDLLSAYGGMGSFPDIVIYPENNHKIQESDVERVNDRLFNLQNEIYFLAKQIKNER